MRYQQDVEVIKKYFNNRADKTGLPLWQHGLNVAKTLEEFLTRYHEVPEGIQDDLLLGALGHDLLEDTDVSENEIRIQWGDQVLYYIKEMTNTKGDSNFDEYIEHLRKADEEVLLIKFADIHANATNSVNNLSTLHTEWLLDFWIPLLERYRRNLLDKDFLKYPATLKALAIEIKDHINMLKNTSKRGV